MSYERQGTAHDPHAAGYELTGRVIPSIQNSIATTTFGPLDKYVAANDNVPMPEVDWARHAEQTDFVGGQYIGLTRGFFAGLTPEQQAAALAYRGEENHGDPAFSPQQANHRAFTESVNDWRTSTDRTAGGLAALAKLDGYIYLGSPYSKCDDLEQAAHDVAEAAGALMNLGLAVYCPIAHGHAISKAEPLPADWDFWKRQCDPMIDAAAALIVLTMDGWQDSVGLNYEIATFLVAQKPILYLSPAELSVGEGRMAA